MEIQQMNNSRNNPDDQQQGCGVITIPEFKLYYRAIVIRQHGTDWNRTLHPDQWERIEEPPISPNFYSQVSFERG